MSERARKVLEEARRLDPSERELLLGELLADLQGPGDLDADEAWAQELARRSTAIDAGEPPAGDAAEVIAELEAGLRRRDH